MTARLSHLRPIPRRGLSRTEAAIYIGVSSSKFDELVSASRMPCPRRIDGRKVWDVRELDMAFAALANHPRGLERGRERVFRWRKSGRLYNMLDAAAAKAGIVMPERAAFHLFRHTYGTWMRRYAGLDVKGLVDTGAWKSAHSAARYAHAVPTEDAQRAALLPLPQIKAG